MYSYMCIYGTSYSAFASEDEPQSIIHMTVKNFENYAFEVSQSTKITALVSESWNPCVDLNKTWQKASIPWFLTFFHTNPSTKMTPSLWFPDTFLLLCNEFNKTLQET